MNSFQNAEPPDDLDLRTRRRAAGLTLVQLAVAAEVSVSALSLLECGYRPRHSEVLARVEQALLTSELLARDEA
ncbi:MAG: helix-turn-helix transcriptional regulator [Patulibacter sp.]|nr:helix-turn-helix transcriptional regulator [Patulibacter sp.]